MSVAFRFGKRSLQQVYACAGIPALAVSFAVIGARTSRLYCCPSHRGRVDGADHEWAVPPAPH